ncbi:MAG TPA: T9SS type A sorting domain-containing protein [Candidatus Eisenbacteria bacterium]|nr:T9SS type A sorting domain-containing protein [Candidatus Eisenbacteria bacterium]
MSPSNRTHTLSGAAPRRVRSWTLLGALALGAFTSGPASADSIDLGWTAPGDDGTSGRAASYEMRYSTSPVSGADTLGWWGGATSAGVLPPPLTAGSRELFSVIGLTTGTTYYFVLRTRDDAGNLSGFSNVRARQAGTPGAPLATPTDFTAQAVTGGVRLAWREPSEGAGSGYHLYRRDGGGAASSDSLLASLPVATTSYVDTTARGGASYEYRVATQQGGLESAPAVASISVPTDLLATTTTTVRGYPNPARDHVTIRLRAGTPDGSPGRVRVVIYDLTGHRISQLFDGDLPAGEQSLSWLCRSDAGSAVAPGVYNVIVDAPSGRSVTQIAVVP